MATSLAIILAVLLSVAVLPDKTAAQLPGHAVIHSRPTSQLVAPGDTAVFNCYASGIAVYWRINGTIPNAPYTSLINKGFTLSSHRQPPNPPDPNAMDMWNLTITVVASPAVNNYTSIQCTAEGWAIGQSDNTRVWLIIARPPQTPAVQIENTANGNALHISWQRPFTHEGYPITNYTLRVGNETTGQSLTFIVPPSDEGAVERVLERGGADVSYSVCDELVFTVTALNSLGGSEPETTHRGFPRVPHDVNASLINTKVRFDTGANPSVTINFTAPELCSFQNATYMIEILNNASGQVAARLGPVMYRSGQLQHKRELTGGLTRDQNYTLQITVYSEFGQTVPASHHFSTKYIPLPIPPAKINVHYSNNGTKLHLSWSTAPLRNHYITNHTITMVNHTNRHTQQWTIPFPTDGRDAVTFDLPGGGTRATSCHELFFEVSSSNVLGVSQANATVVTGYPIVPDEISELNAVTTFQTDGTPLVTISFSVPEVCSFQEINYTLVVFDESGQSVHQIGPATYSGRERRQMSFPFPSGKADHSYSIGATVVGHGAQVESRMEKFSISQPNSGSDVHQLVVITGTALGVAVFVCIIVIIIVVTMVTLVCACRRSRRNKTIEKEAKQRKAGAPKSLPPMAMNPIYDGPLYDSPGGDSLKSLLNSGSSASSTPVVDSPRYFIDHTPPRLPPPRKASLSISSPLPQISEHEMDQIKFSFDVAVPLGDSEYTIMNPARNRPVVTGQSAQGVQQGSSAKGQPEDEYVTIKCK